MSALCTLLYSCLRACGPVGGRRAMGHAAQQQAGGAGLGCTLAGVQVWSREADAWMHCALQDRGLTRGMFRGQDQVAPHDPSIVCAVPLAILKVASDPALNGRHSSSHDYPGDTWTCHVHLDVLEVLEVMIPLRLCSSNASIRPRPPQLSILRRATGTCWRLCSSSSAGSAPRRAAQQAHAYRAWSLEPSV